MKKNFLLAHFFLTAIPLVYLLGCSSSLTKDTTPSFETEEQFLASNVSRINPEDNISCGESTEDLRNQLNTAQSESPPEDTLVILASDFCEGQVGDNGQFYYDTERNSLQGVFLVSPSPQLSSYYWLFILVNDKDVTAQALDGKNLINLSDYSTTSIPFSIDNLDGSSVVVSAILINASAAYDHETGYWIGSNSSTIDFRDATPITNLAYADGQPGEVFQNTGARMLYSELGPSEDGGTLLELSFRHDFETNEFNLFPIDPAIGEHVPMDCGADSNELINVIASDVMTTNIVCEFSNQIDYKKLFLSFFVDSFVQYKEDLYVGAFYSRIERFGSFNFRNSLN